MDPNDLDQTQAIFMDEPDEDDGTDELLPDAERQPRGFLKVLFQKGMIEKSYPLFEGENVIGRSADTCHVCIASKALSKEHACIEIIKDSHLIYDKGSRNKTKRGKLFLSPEVRYELSSKDEISFADIRCIYTKQEVNCAYSETDGSETDGSESLLLQMEISKDKSGSEDLPPAKPSRFAQTNDSTLEPAVEENNGDDDSFLQPTQTFAKEKAANPALCVQETPEKEYNEKVSTLVLSESESEEEEERSIPKKSEQPKSKLSATLLCEDSDAESSVDSEKFCMATQAYYSESEKDTNNEKHKAKSVSPKCEKDKAKAYLLDEPTQACLLDEPTQAFLQTDADPGGKKGSMKSPDSHISNSNKDKSTEGTQSFDVSNEENEAKKGDQTDTVLESTQVFEEDDGDDEDMMGLFAMATMAPDGMNEEEEENEDDEDKEASEAMPFNHLESETMPVNNDATLPVSKGEVGTKSKPKDNGSEALTRISDAPAKKSLKSKKTCDKNDNTTKVPKETVSVSDTVDIDCAPTDVKKFERTKRKNCLDSKAAATLIVEQEESGSEDDDSDVGGAETMVCGDLGETQAYGNESPAKVNKQKNKPVLSKDLPTQLYGKDEDIETQAYGDDNEVDDECEKNDRHIIQDEPTQAYHSTSDDATQAFDDDENNEKDSDSTQVVAFDEPTQKINFDEATQNFIGDEATQAMENDEPTKKVAVEATQVISEDEPTQRIGFDEPTQKVNFDEPTQMVVDDDSTQQVGEEEPTQMITNDEPTQKFDFPDDNDNVPNIDRLRKEEESASDDDSDLEESSMLKAKHLKEDDATQVFEMKPLSPEAVTEEVQPTLAYNMEVEDNVKTVNRNEKKESGPGEGKGNMDEKVLLKSGDGNKEIVQKDPSNEKNEDHVQPSTSAESECYSYPLSPCLEDIGKDDVHEDTEEMEMECDVKAFPKSPPHPLPRRSPLKPALVDRKRSPSPSPPKRVAFADTKDDVSSNETKTSSRGKRSLLSKETSGNAKRPTRATTESAKDDTAQATKRSGRRSSNKVEASKAEDTSELKNEEEKQERKEIKPSEKESEDLSETATSSKRGKRKKDTANKEEQKQNLEAASNSASSEINLDSEKETASSGNIAINEGKPTRGKNSKGKKKAIHSASKEECQTGTELHDKAIINSSPHIDLEPEKEVHEKIPETSEDVEAGGSTSRRGRRITKSTLYKDFETGGMKKRESLTKSAKAQTRKYALDSSNETEDENTKNKNIKDKEIEPISSDLPSSVAPSRSRKRKNDTDDGKEDGKEVETVSEKINEQPEKANSNTRSMRGKKAKIDGKEKNDENDNQVETITRTRNKVPSNTETLRNMTKENEKEDSKTITAKEVKQTRPQNKRISTNIETNTENPEEKSKDDDPSTAKAASQPHSQNKRSKGRGKSSTPEEQKVDDVTAEAEVEDLVEKSSSNKRDRSSRKLPESQQFAEIPTTKGKRGKASATVVNESQTVSNKNVKGLSQESTKGKRKRTSPEEEKEVEEISSTPAKRAKPNTTAVLSSPILRVSTTESKPKVMFTGVIDEQGEKTVKELGGELVTNIQDCSHLVTDKIRRTVKFLGGLAKGVLIVSPLWLENSKRAGTFLDGHKFLVRDHEMEKQFKFNLGNSITQAKKQACLTGFHIHVSKSVRPDPNQMRDILLCAGAEVLTKMPGKAADKTIVISCPDDERLCKAAIKAKIPVVTAEFILTGILQQDIDTSPYLLFK